MLSDTNSSSLSARSVCAALRHGLLGILLLSSAGVSMAQNVVYTPQVDLPPPPVLRTRSDVPPPSTLPRYSSSPLIIGPAVLHPEISYRYLHANGLPINGTRVDSEVHTFTTALSGDVGDNLSFMYRPSWTNYSSGRLSSSFNQAASVTAAAAFSNWGINASEQYTSDRSLLVETASQVKRTTWSTGLGAGYTLTPRMQLSFSGGYNQREVETTPDVKSYSGSARIAWKLSDHLNISAANSYGYNEIVDSPDYYNDNYTAGLKWSPTEKLGVSFDGGVQRTHSTATNGVDFSSGIMDMSLSYQLSDSTSLSAAVAKSVSPSYFSGQVTKNVRWSFGINQRLFSRVYLSAGYGFYDNEYIQLANLNLVERKDRIEALNFEISTKLGDRTSISASWHRKENKTDLATYRFASEQYGLNLSYRY